MEPISPDYLVGWILSAPTDKVFLKAIATQSEAIRDEVISRLSAIEDKGMDEADHREFEDKEGWAGLAKSLTENLPKATAGMVALDALAAPNPVNWPLMLAANTLFAANVAVFKGASVALTRHGLKMEDEGGARYAGHRRHYAHHRRIGAREICQIGGPCGKRCYKRNG